MNERIKELAMELAEQYDWDPPHDPTYYTFSSDDLKKFAELIVRECVKVVDDTMTENQEMNIGLVMASAAIVAHFGVEE